MTEVEPTGQRARTCMTETGVSFRHQKYLADIVKYGRRIVSSQKRSIRRGCTLAPTGEYDQIFRVRQRCGLMCDLFGQLSVYTCRQTSVYERSAAWSVAASTRMRLPATVTRTPTSVNCARTRPTQSRAAPPPAVDPFVCRPAGNWQPASTTAVASTSSSSRDAGNSIVKRRRPNCDVSVSHAHAAVTRCHSVIIKIQPENKLPRSRDHVTILAHSDPSPNPCP